jgi:hypothetical protein
VVAQSRCSGFLLSSLLIARVVISTKESTARYHEFAFLLSADAILASPKLTISAEGHAD